MNEASGVVWRRRIACAAAVINLAYVLIALFQLANGVAFTLGRVNATPSGWERVLMFFFMGSVLVLLVIGLAIASPLLTWLTALAVGLWRGRRWARIGGMITFTLAIVAFGVLVVRSGPEFDDCVRAVLFASPALVGLVVLISGAPAFPKAAPRVELPTE